MRIWPHALFVLLALTPVNAHAQTIRTLFVGVDSYQYSANPDRKASFKDLKGAVSDSFRFKEAMRSLYKVEVDSLTPQTLTAQNCAGNSASSITLVNHCAKREAILAALDTLISRSKPKDTLLFYFAGHGSQYPDDTDFEQASGYNGTILPTDAREPGAIAKGDILDKELKAIKDRATAAGIYFVTVFDSCNSGTATRDGASGQSRSVPMLGGKPALRPTPRQPDGPGGGYWTHLAAAQDGEQAQEVGAVGQREGVFTTALIETMFAMPGGTFGDLIRETRIRVALGGHSSQTPMAEGILTASLGSGARRAVSFAARRDSEKATIAVGRLSGMTIGSEFAFYASEADAFGSSPMPLATGKIITLTDFSATLKLDGATPTLGTNLVAIETRHAYGDLKLLVANMMKSDAESKLVQAALDALPFVGIDSKPVAQITSHPKKKGEAILRASDGTAIGDLGPVASPDFTDLLQAKLKKIQRAQQLLELGKNIDPHTNPVRFCIDDSIYAAVTDACPPMEKRQMRVLKRDAESIVTVNNEGDKPLHFYVFGIDPSFGVALILPAPGGKDPALEPLQPYRIPNDPVVPTTSGIYRFVTLATTEEINAAALEQDGTNSRSSEACNTVLARLLCDANKGVRDPTAPRVGDWKAVVETVIVE